MKTVAKNITEFFKMCVSYGITKAKLNLCIDEYFSFCLVDLEEAKLDTGKSLSQII